MTATLKSINANIKTIAAQAGKLDALAKQTAELILQHGEETRHYDRAAALVNALSFNQRLQKETIAFFVGKLPHSLTLRNGEYKLGKRDDSLLKSGEELAAAAAEKAAKREETTAKAAAKREEQKQKLAGYDALQTKLEKLAAEKAQLEKELKAARREIARLQAQTQTPEKAAA